MDKKTEERILTQLSLRVEAILTNAQHLTGDTSYICGDAVRIWGDVSGIRGDVSGIRGNVSEILEVLSRE